MRRVLPALAAAALALAGCGGGGSAPAGQALQETADRLGSIRSGDLTFEVEIDPRGDGEPFGFAVAGLFAVAEGRGLPTLDVEYTQTASGASETVRLVSNGQRAVVEVDGGTVELSGDQLDQLRGAGSALTGAGSGETSELDKLQIDGWLVDPQRSDGPDGTDKIDGELDIVALTNGLLGVFDSFGGGEARQIKDADAEQLRDAVESADFEILTGKDDRLLRKLSFDISLGLDVPEELRDALGEEVVGADISFLLELDEPNEPVDVSLPSG